MSLAEVIEKLKRSPQVRGIFTTGSTVSDLSPSSDIDLVIILDRNDKKIRSVYTEIEDHFADVFFFDVNFIRQLGNKKEVATNDLEGIFSDWLAKGNIKYDPDGVLADFNHKLADEPLLRNILDSEKRDFWLKINYNFIANERYFNSGDGLYHQALELRLLYSVSELILAYFSFRDIPWRGEKAAVKYFEENDKKFLSTFQVYSKSVSLEEKMKNYNELFQFVFWGDYKKWNEDFLIGVSSDNKYESDLAKFWEDLIK